MVSISLHTLARRTVSRRHPLTRVRYQLGVALLFCALLPLIARYWVEADTGQYAAGLLYTFIASATAVLIGDYLVRTVCAYPGFQPPVIAVPSMVVGFAIVVGVLFMTRVDYIRSSLLVSFVVAVIWYAFVLSRAERLRTIRIGLVPFGDALELTQLGGVEWVPLTARSALSAPVDGIVADLRADLSGEWERVLSQCAVEGRLVYHSKQLREAMTGMVRIDHVSENSFGSLMPLAAYQQVKRGVDIVVSLVALPFIAVLLLVVWPLVAREGRGPLIFKQVRTGFRGRPFTIYKIRTMRQERAGEDCKRARAMTVDDDPRITRIGRFLRRSRLDELPQVWNILRGDMSWIGPRPEAEALSQWYEAELPFYVYRHVVRPGITGWAQVNQGHVAEVHEVNEKLQNDFYYIKYFSPWLDALIVLRTIGIVFTGFGAR